MGTTTRQQGNTLTKWLLSAHSFNFFQAVRLIKRLSIKDKTEHSVYFKAKPALNFAFADISHAKANPKKANYGIDLYQSFMGLCGQNAILPEHFMELLLLRLEEKDETLADFFDIFNHRMVSLYYQSWEKAHFYVEYEKQNANTSHNSALSLIASLTGQTISPKSPVDNETLLYYAGIYQHKVRSKEGLCMILSDYFELPFTLNEYKGEWIDLNPDEQTRLSNQTNAHHNILGTDTLLGRRIWQVQYHFEVLVGPLNYQQFMAHLPNGNILNMIRTIISDYVGQEFDFHITLCLNAHEIEPCSLRQNKPFHLGWNSWLSATHLKQYNEKVSLSNDIISSFAKPNIRLITKRNNT